MSLFLLTVTELHDIMDHYNVATLTTRHPKASCSSRTSLPAVYKHPHVDFQDLFRLRVRM